jgi:hypothetical protein
MSLTSASVYIVVQKFISIVLPCSYIPEHDNLNPHLFLTLLSDQIFYLLGHLNFRKEVTASKNKGKLPIGVPWSLFQASATLERVLRCCRDAFGSNESPYKHTEKVIQKASMSEWDVSELSSYLHLKFFTVWWSDGPMRG